MKIYKNIYFVFILYLFCIFLHHDNKNIYHVYRMSLVYTKLGGGIHGVQPKGGLSGLTLDGGNRRSMTRLVLRSAFGNGGRMYNGNIRYVPDASEVTRKKYLNVINNSYNAVKY